MIFENKNQRYSLTALLLLVSVLFASCSGAGGSGTDTSAPDSTEADTTVAESVDIYASLPEGDFDGYNFRMLQYEETTAVTAFCDAKELNGEVINDDIYNRSRNVEQKLNVKISHTLETLANVNTIMSNAIIAGEDVYDTFWQHSTTTTQNFLSKGYLLDMSDISTLDFTEPWRNTTATEDISLGNKIFYAFGDINIQLYDFQSVISFNKDIVKSYSLDNPYDLVNGGSWTMDRFIEMGSEVSGDTNGNGIVDAEDMSGFGGYATATMFGFMHGADVSLFTKDKDGMPSYNGISAKFESVYDRYCAFFSNKTYSHVNDNYTEIFSAGNMLFMSQGVGQLSLLRDIEPDYGIIPFPKYDEAQEGYISFITNQIQPTVLPITNTDPERAGAILANLSAESYRLVRDDYFALLLNQKYVRDETSIEMLDLIYNSPARFELEHIYDWAAAQRIIASGFMTPGVNIVTSIAAIESKMLAAMENTLDYLGLTTN